MNVVADPSDTAHLDFGFDRKLPDTLFAGRGTVLPLKGWCYSVEALVSSLDFVAGDQVVAIPNHSWSRTDIFTKDCPARDPSGNSLMSGFEGFIPVAAPETDTDMPIVLRATLANGRVIERHVTTMRIRCGSGMQPAAVVWPSTGPRVAVCMAMFRPPIELFRQQVETIRAQTHQNWICMISDDNSDNEYYDRIRFIVVGDPRFVFFQNRERLDFYENFQAVLRRTPADADYVALCDQDDIWHPGKLETLLAKFEPRTSLVFSDARIVDENGNVKSKTFWSRRRNNYTDLATLMVANTITGAASMIDRRLLDDVLPFPEPVGPAFHDHWIGLVAMLGGRIGYVDKPLYDYVQHGGGVIGHNYHRWPGAVAVFWQVLRQAPSRNRMARTATLALKQALDDHQFALQKAMLARILLQRFPACSASQRSTLERFSRFETSIAAAAGEKVRSVIERRPTLNIEGLLLWSMLGARLRNQALRLQRPILTKRQLENPSGRLLDALIASPASPAQQLIGSEESSATRTIPALEFGTTRWIHHNIKPLTLAVSEAHPKRINLLLATINFSYVFGGYIGMFNLALRLRREGYRPRLILHEKTDWDLAGWRNQIQKYPGLETLFEDVEVISRFDRDIPVEVNPDDRFVATNCWAAHIAHHTMAQLGRQSFLFMVQEYEPFFLPMNSISALFQQAYDLPQTTLFSTELLQDYFRRERIGIYSGADGDGKAIVFRNAVQKFQPSREALDRKERRLLFYARTEEHAARNLFELGIMAIAQLVADPRLNLDGWSFHGIGSLGGNRLQLADGLVMELLPKVSLEDYAALMPSFDVGLSLMMTPHPSLVPIEMASAGMWVVTNTFADKTAERLESISTNIIGVRPTVDAICDGLREAVRRVDQLDDRLAGSSVDWPSDWGTAFSAESLHRIRQFAGQL